MDTERRSGARLWTLAGLCLLIYWIIGTLAFLSWEGRREAKAIVGLAEKYQQTHGHPPDCDCDLGNDEHHAFYKKKYDIRYIVSALEQSA